MRLSYAAAGFAALALTAGLAAQEIVVRADRPGVPFSRDAYGIFFEEISHAGDGGLYAELVRNRSFDESENLDAWSPVGDTARPPYYFDSELPLNPTNRRSLRMDLGGGGRAGVANEGYWGIPVRQGAAYRFSMYARARAPFQGPLTVSLEDAKGTVYAATEINGLSPSWNKFTATLTSKATDPKARLVIASTAAGTVWIDVVSLFPQDVPLFRPDLLDRLKALRPSFMRFPGGTYVNGNDRASRFNWKTTVGDIAARPGHSNLHWKYWSTDGLGYHEYLLLAEALGADPLYVTYIGMSWQTTNLSPFGFLTESRTPVQEVPLDQLEPLIQDALDAIEYANGPVTSKWGALRAQAGHPKPFGLKYVEIGNEDGWSASYPERYARFYKAIKARYPEMRIVSNSSRNIPRETLDLLDAHAYIAPYAALETGKRYNDYDRKGPKVYFGEFSVQRSAGPGNLRSALAEAAMLVQFEVNSDVVPMVSFAPLFANVNSVNWRPNLIWFDGVSSFATPSYYVQKMLSENRPATVLPVEVSADTVPLPLDGGIGLAMSDTQAEFRNLRLTSGGKTILAPDFASGAEVWKTFRGQWSARDGVYRQTGSGFDLRTTAAAVSGTDYTLTVEARKTGGAEGVRILFGVQDGGERYMSWNVGDRRRGQLGFWNGGPPGDVPVSSVESSFGGAIGAQPELSLEPGRWYELKVEVSGRRVRCSLDGRQINEITVPETLGPAIYAGAGRADDGDIILKIVNIAPAGQEVAVRVAGLAEIEPRGLATVLTSGSLEDENTLADPERVVPRRQTPEGLAAPVRYRIPGNSVTVLRVKGKK